MKTIASPFESTNTLTLISRQRFVFPVVGQTVPFPSRMLAGCSPPGHRQQGWSPPPSAELLQTSWRHCSPLCIYLHILCYFQLCSFSLNLFSWCKNVLLVVFLLSFSPIGSVCRASGQEAVAVGAGLGLQLGLGHGGEDQGRGQRCRKAPWTGAGAVGVTVAGTQQEGHQGPRPLLALLSKQPNRNSAIGGRNMLSSELSWSVKINHSDLHCFFLSYEGLSVMCT